MNILVTAILCVLGFVFLVKGADWLVEGASSIAKRMHLSELLIGFTIVAFGTSMPELVVNIISNIDGYNDVVFGNIIGSNIFNTFAILGISGLIYPITIQQNTIWKEIPFSFAITLIFFILINDVMFFGSETNEAGRIDGFILILLFSVFMYYLFRYLRKDFHNNDEGIKKLSIIKSISFISLGIILLGAGGQLVVYNAVKIAHYFQVSEKLIGLTAISAGTSLPELATSVIAAFKKRPDIAIGNVIGSNIFNITLVLGVTSLMHPVVYDSILNFDVNVLLGGTLLLFVFMFTLTVKKLDRWEAALLSVLFIAYMIYLFIRK